MKNLTFQIIYDELKSLENGYLLKPLDTIMSDEPKYIKRFNAVFAELSDSAYDEILGLFREFGRDFVDFNKEIQAKKKILIRVTNLIKNGFSLAPIFVSATYLAFNDFVKSVKKQRELGISWADAANIHNPETLEKLNQLSSIINDTKTDYKYLNLRSLKNDYNFKLAKICQKHQIELGKFKAFVPFEQIFKTYS